MKNILLISGSVLAMAVSIHAQAPVDATGTTSPAAAATASSAQDLESLRAQEKTLKSRIALTQDNINTYKSWFGHPLTPAQRIDTQDKIDRAKTLLATYQTQLAALDDKIKVLDPTATSAASTSNTPDPKWPFKH
ncbi:MAG: hypothetical protein WCD79_18710 [Chthoniobacteraceae bacterium]